VKVKKRKVKKNLIKRNNTIIYLLIKDNETFAIKGAVELQSFCKEKNYKF
jgi:hypothetical protein